MAAASKGPGDLAARLTAARHAMGLTQSELAVQSGVKLDTVRSIEQRKIRNPGIFTVLRLAEVLDITLDSLVRP
jgi:transcriptional regulator with XRE-family HTH domain